MKKDLILPTSFSILLILLICGAIFLPVEASTIQASAVFKPEKINLQATPSTEFLAEISFPKEYRDQTPNIDPDTVLLDGTIPLSRYESAPNRFKAFFDGQVFVDYLWLKVYHISGGEPFKSLEVELEISGELYDDTPFEASGTILVSAK